MGTEFNQALARLRPAQNGGEYNRTEYVVDAEFSRRPFEDVDGHPHQFRIGDIIKPIDGFVRKERAAVKIHYRLRNFAFNQKRSR